MDYQIIDRLGSCVKWVVENWKAIVKLLIFLGILSGAGLAGYNYYNQPAEEPIKETPKETKVIIKSDPRLDDLVSRLERAEKEINDLKRWH